MTYARSVWRLILAACLIAWAGCDFGDGFEDLGGLGCAFDFEFDHPIRSDRGALEAEVRCEKGADCADRRTVIKGSSFDVAIEVSPRGSSAPTASASTDGLEITGFEAEEDPCGGYRLVGTAHYREVGTAALIISDGEGEFDRFTVTVHEPHHLDVMIADPSTSESVSLRDGDTISIDTFRFVRAFVRNAEGERLVGAQDIGLEIEDTSIASLDGWWLIHPRAIGTTTLQVRGAGLAAELQLEVTGVPEDAGVSDAAIED